MVTFSMGPMKIRYSLAPSIVGFVFLLSGLAWAEDGDYSADSGSLLAPPREWVSSLGWGGAQDAWGIAGAITTVTRRELDLSEYQNIQGAIRSEPGIAGAPAEGLPSWWNPGVSIRGLGGARLGVFSDGVPQSLQGLELGDGGNLSLYDPFSVERIEVVRGNYAPQFGGSALGGVINVIQRAPKERDLFGLNVSGRSAFDGSVNAMRHSGLVDFGGEDFGIIAGGTSVGSERPVTPGDPAAAEGAYRTASGWANSRVRLTGGTTLHVSGVLNHNSDVLTAAESITDSPVALSRIESQSPRYQRSLVSAEVISRDLGAGIDALQSKLSWQQFTRRDQSMLVNPEQTVQRFLTDDAVNAILWNTALQVPWGAHHLSLAYDFGYDESDLETSYPQQMRERAHRLFASQYRSGLHAEDRLALGRFELIPSARLEYFTADDKLGGEEIHNHGESAGVSALYHLKDSRAVYIKGGSGYRNPTLAERFYRGELVGSSGSAVLAGASALGGERGNDVELGIKEATPEFTYAVAGFYHRLHDYIGIGVPDQVQVDSSESLIYRSIPSLSLAGFEVEASVQVIDEVKLFGNLSQAWSNHSQDIDLPALSANYGVRYQQELCDCTSLKQFTGTLYARSLGDSVDRTPAPIRESFPSGQGFTTINLEGALEFAPLPMGDLTLLMGVHNLANSRYREPFYDQLQPGLTGYVALALTY